MAFEAEFYIPENIIAYTGILDQKPTVYFLRDEVNGTRTFGHITQNWFDGTFGRSNSPNVGREVLRNAGDYVIGNVNGAMLEHAPSIGFTHTSRTAVTVLDPGTLAKTKYFLGLAIAAFPCEKAWNKLTPGERKQFSDGAVYLR